MKRIFYIIKIFTLFILFSCDNKTNDTEVLTASHIIKIDSILDKKFYPSKVAVFNDTVLNIEMELPELEFTSETKMKIIREMALYSIIELTDRYKGVIFTNYNNKHPYDKRYISKTYLPKESLTWLKNLPKENKTLLDFKTYVVTNIKGDKLYKFDGVVHGIYTLHSDGRKVDKTDDNYEDYFEIIEQYSLECQGKIEGNHYREFLHRIKFLSSDTINFPDFDPNDVNYFLYYNNDHYKKNNLLITDTIFYETKQQVD